MYYTTFVKKMREQVQEQLGEKYQVEIVNNSKLNGAEKTGLTIRRMAGTATSGSCSLFGRML